MTKQKSSWTYEDFLAYVLLYAASADLEITEEEKEMLFSKVKYKEYEHIHREFERENDYTRLQTIQSFRVKYYNNEASRDKLFSDLKEMFMADDKYNSIERAFFMGLKKVLR